MPKTLIRVLPLTLLCLAAACGRQKATLTQPMSRARGDDGSGFYKLRGQTVAWGKVPVVFSFDPSVPAEFKDACASAAATWNGAGDRPLIEFSTTDHPFAEGPDGVNVISVGQSQRAFSPNHAAETVNLIGRKNPPRIIESDIDFDRQHLKFGRGGGRGEVDIESACLHELGHALGLTHVEDSDSIMASRLTLGATKRAVSTGDQARVRQLYATRPKKGAR